MQNESLFPSFEENLHVNRHISHKKYILLTKHVIVQGCKKGVVCVICTTGTWCAMWTSWKMPFVFFYFIQNEILELLPLTMRCRYDGADEDDYC